MKKNNSENDGNGRAMFRLHDRCSVPEFVEVCRLEELAESFNYDKRSNNDISSLRVQLTHAFGGEVTNNSD